jgi:hypothetical protein
MSNHECKCQHPAASVHGVCNRCYGMMRTKYNPRPEQPKAVSTARGKRRLYTKK